MPLYESDTQNFTVAVDGSRAQIERVGASTTRPFTCGRITFVLHLDTPEGVKTGTIRDSDIKLFYNFPRFAFDSPHSAACTSDKKDKEKIQSLADELDYKSKFVESVLKAVAEEKGLNHDQMEAVKQRAKEALDSTMQQEKAAIEEAQKKRQDESEKAKAEALGTKKQAIEKGRATRLANLEKRKQDEASEPPSKRTRQDDDPQLEALENGGIVNSGPAEPGSASGANGATDVS